MAKPDPAADPLQHERPCVEGVALLLLAMEAAGPAVRCWPLARLGPDYVAATVFIDVDGTGGLPFALTDVRLTADALRADPPFPGAAALADRLDDARRQAGVQALSLLEALH